MSVFINQKDAQAFQLRTEKSQFGEKYRYLYPREVYKLDQSNQTKPNSLDVAYTYHQAAS